MRICFLGTPEPAVPSLRAFLQHPDVDVAAVITNPDRPAGRGYKVSPPPVAVAAAEAGVAVWQPTKPGEVVEHLRALRLDACAVVAYGSLLPPDVLAGAAKGFVNLHFSLLPRWRGAAPVQHAIRAGDPITGVTCFVLDEGMDTGPVLNWLSVPVGVQETAGELTTRLAELGAPLLVEAVRGLIGGELTPKPQDNEGATLAPKIRPEQAQISWTSTADEVHRVVRAFNPVPGAWTTLRGDRLKIHGVRVSEQVTDQAGVVFGTEPDGPVVACGEGAVVLLEVQPAGKPRMGGAAFVNGYRPVSQRLE